MNRHDYFSRRLFQVLAVVMMLSGCTGFQASQSDSPHLYVLDARPAIKEAQVRRDLVLAVSTPRAWPGLDTPQMAYVRQPHALDYFAVNRWADTPAHMLEPLLGYALEQTRSFRAIVRAPGSYPADIRLETELIRLQQDFQTQPSQVQLTLRTQLIDVASKRIIAVKQFDGVENAPSDNAYGGVIAANRLLQRMLGELADFCVNASASQ